MLVRTTELPADIGTETITCRMAGTAMSQAIDQIGSPVPLIGLPQILLELLWFKIQEAPACQQTAQIIGKVQGMRLIGLMNRLDRLQKGEQCIGILTRDERVVGVGKYGIQQAAIGCLAEMERLPEIVGTPISYSGFFVGRDIGPEEFAKWRVDGAAASIGWAAARSMAADAVASAGQVSTARDLLIRGTARGLTHCAQ